MFERFTAQARTTVIAAQQEARELGHAQVGTEHLLLGLLDTEGSPAHRVLAAAGITKDGLRADIERLDAAPGQVLSDEDAAALRTVGIDLDAVLARIEESFGPGAIIAQQPSGARSLFRRRRNASRFGPRAKKVLELALREALRLKDKQIGAEHILLGLIRDGAGLGAKIVVDAGVDLDALRRELLGEMGKAA